MTEIKKLWQLISINSDSILELRAIWPKGVQGHFYPITEHFRVAERSGPLKLDSAISGSLAQPKP